MARAFIALTDRVVAPAPKVWPGGAGSVFFWLKPTGWSSGVGGDHVFFMYGFQSGAGRSFLGCQRFSDQNVYAGWVGDGAHGGEQRLIVSDAGLFKDGVWSSHLITWDDGADQVQYYVNGTLRGTRSAPLTSQVLSGDANSNVTIGNHNQASTDADTRGSLAFFARWNRVLTAVESAQLQRGAHPLDLPAGLVECVDLGSQSPEADLQSAVTYTVTGTKEGADPFQSPSVVRALARKFEPVLLFHAAEEFTPIDPKWYLEQTALWPATPGFTLKQNWGELPGSPFPHAPRLQRQALAAVAGEVGPGRKWLGDSSLALGVATLPTQQEADPKEELFLDFVGWNPVVAPPNEVDVASNNRHPALNAADYVGPLAGSRPWYYAEHLNSADLSSFAANRSASGFDLSSLITALGSPSVLLYYFLYPLHQEALEHCAAAGEGGSFATYAGEWACVAIVFGSAGEPRFIGVSTRNVGKPSQTGTVDQRVGMTVFPWTAATTVPGSGGQVHPKIFVSRGTHGQYLSVGPHTVTPFAGGNDYSGRSCGAVEATDDAISGNIVIPGTDSDLTPIGIIFVKAVITIATLGLGTIWMMDEFSDDHFGTSDQNVTTTPTATDQTGGPAFGTIIRPNGLAVSEEASALRVIDWQVDRRTADGRVYDCVVSRPAQVWWTPRMPVDQRFEGPGWTGRWGPRVTNDPFHRRAGGKCPEFLTLFLEAIAITLNG